MRTDTAAASTGAERRRGNGRASAQCSISRNGRYVRGSDGRGRRDNVVGDDVDERIAGDANLATDPVGRGGEDDRTVDDPFAVGGIDVADHPGAAQARGALVEEVPVAGDALRAARRQAQHKHPARPS